MIGGVSFEEKNCLNRIGYIPVLQLHPVRFCG